MPKYEQIQKAYVEMVKQVVESEGVNENTEWISYPALPHGIVEDHDEGGFVVSYPDLPGCITCGETVESAVANAQDAKRAWLEAALEDGIPIREPDDLESYSGQFKLRIPKSLHKSLTEHAKREGISMNQYCVYLLSKNDAATAR